MNELIYIKGNLILKNVYYYYTVYLNLDKGLQNIM